MRTKITAYWILAIFVTLTTVVFQRMTGPTNPRQVRFVLDGKDYSSKLPRSITIEGDSSTLMFTVKGLPDDMNPSLFIRKYKSKEKWTTCVPQREGDLFRVQLSSEPAAAKIEYYLLFTQTDDDIVVMQEDTTVARFKNSVPAFILVPHIVLMFAAMLLCCLSGLLALFRRERYMTYAKAGFACLLLGGIVLGCLVQKAAFGHYWTGFPLGTDVTDNKTLLVFVVWLVAILANWRRNRHPLWITIALAFMLLVYCIPHSMGGSEYNYQTGTVESGSMFMPHDSTGTYNKN
jgi:hypothetical protein